MKRMISVLLMLVILLSAITMGAAADAPAGCHTMTVKVLGEGGVVPEGTSYVPDGDDFSLYFFPDKGYEVIAIYVDGYPMTHVLPYYRHSEDCDGCEECDWIDWERVYIGSEDDDWDDWKSGITLREVCRDHLIYVEFKKIAEEEPEEPAAEPEKPVFTDLTAGAWYADAVDFVVEAGLMNGVGNGRFDPDGVTTRAQLVTMLWRLEKQPQAETTAVFADVAADSWYADAVAWAAANRIVNGSNGMFSPSDPVTREQLASILWRYAQYRGMDVSIGENTNILSYNDAFDVTEYAYPALQWACGAGILNGTDGWLMPQGNASRVQTAAMLYRFLN